MSKSIARILTGGFLLLMTGLTISKVPLQLKVLPQQQVNTTNAAPSTSVSTTDTPTTTNDSNQPLQQQQQQRWQPFQVEINDYIESSKRRHHTGTIATKSIDPWEYPALSAESLALSLRNRTIYIDGDSLSYYFAVLLLHCLDYLCENGVDGKNPSPPVTDVKTILENEALYSGVKEHYYHLWGGGPKQFDRCFLRVGGGANDAKDDDEEKTITEDEAMSSYVIVKHSFYYNQADSAEKSMLSTASANNSEVDEKQTTTDVAVLDFAILHRLHLFPIRDSWTTEMMMANLGPSIKFEEQIKRTVDLASGAGARCVFLRTPNPICESKQPNGYLVVREYYRNLEELDRRDNVVFDEEGCRDRIGAWKSRISDSVSSSWGKVDKTDLCNATRLRSKRFELETRCVEMISNQLISKRKKDGEKYNYGDDDRGILQDVQALCSYRFSQTNIGLENRRGQIRHFVLTNQERYQRERNVKLIYFDWYRIVKDHDNYCQYTIDSVHYGSLLPVQLKLITNIISRHCS